MTTEMVPRQHSDDPVAHEDTDAKGSRCECVMQGWWGAPGNRVPTGRRHGKRGGACKRQIVTRCKHEHLMHRKHSFSEGHLGGYTFEACILGGVRIRCKVEEVDVHGSSREVVVHVWEVVEVRVFDNGRRTRSEVDGRGTRDLGDGRGRRFRRCSSHR